MQKRCARCHNLDRVVGRARLAGHDQSHAGAARFRNIETRRQDHSVRMFQTTAGGALLFPVAGAAPSIYRADAGLATPYSQQVNLAVEHLLARDLTASASYCNDSAYNPRSNFYNLTDNRTPYNL